MTTPDTVIIGDHTQGLGILRSAAAVGSRVWVVNDKAISLARFSKYISGYRRVSRGTLRMLGDSQSARVLQTALAELPVRAPALLFGVDEDIVRFIHRHAKQLSERYFIPDVSFDKIYDKYVFNTLVPESARIETRLWNSDERRSIQERHRFIVKGRHGVAFKQITGQKAIRLDRLTPHVQERLSRHLAPDQVLVQEIIESNTPVTSVCSFSVAGCMAATFAYEKLRQHPVDFGTGTYLRSVPAGELAPVAERIVQSTMFTGISEIEFIFDRRTRQYKAIEMNPRTWKSTHFSTQCGQNLVARYLDYVATGEVAADNGYAANRYWSDLATDIPQLLRHPKHASYHGRFFECTWDRSDPVPAAVLWTLFPLIAVENKLSALTAFLRTGRTTPARAANPART